MITASSERRRGPVEHVDGRPALELRDEDREALAELMAGLLVEAIMAGAVEAAR